MSITSFSYLAFILAGAVLYYIVPRRAQWVELLVLSIVFYVLAASPATILYLIGSTLVAYISTMYLASPAASTERGKRTGVALAAVAIIANIAVWFAVKGDSILVSLYAVAHKILPVLPAFDGFHILAALGMGYYSLQVIGYILDCAWENIQPQRNILKLFLFVSFFPQLTTGPISRYSQLEHMYEPHSFSYRNLAFGAQRILWGFFKKLVIAERLGILVGNIYAQPETYTGWYLWIALLLYPFQIYTDFSSSMDIVLGTAEIFGIHMPENFNNPFFSRTSQEFWQRWHMTLGGWAKDYILYPVLKSSPMVRFGKFTRKKLGKKTGKIIATSAGMFFLWMAMGIWHGAMKYLIGLSLWYWLILTVGDLLKPTSARVISFLRIPTESFSWHLFQSVRTYVIYSFGAIFFRVARISDGFAFLGSLFTFTGKNGSFHNPWIFFDGSILTLGITYGELNLLIFGTALLFAVAVLREKYGYAREWVAKQALPFRWMIWLVFFALVLVYGKYGPGFNASEFIYGGF